MRTLARLTIVLALAMLAGGCNLFTAGTAEVTVNLAQVCPSWRQIDVSKDDKLSKDTEWQILGNNLARQAAGCKYEPPPPKAKPAPKQVAEAAPAKGAAP